MIQKQIYCREQSLISEVNSELSQTFEYKDSKLGDSEWVIFYTSPKVFYPTSTSVLILRVLRRLINDGAKSILDLGCGCGVISIVLARKLSLRNCFFASDICKEAAMLTRKNAEFNNVVIDCRIGNLFEPWRDKKFDIIIDDVSGMAEPIAKISKWYPPQIYCNAGMDGTRWTIQILEQGNEYLSPEGFLFFPVLTLSEEKKIINKAKERFKTVKLADEQWYPFDTNLLANIGLIKDLAGKKIIEIKKKGSRWLWATKIYVASNTSNF